MLKHQKIEFCKQFRRFRIQKLHIIYGSHTGSTQFELYTMSCITVLNLFLAPSLSHTLSLHTSAFNNNQQYNIYIIKTITPFRWAYACSSINDQESPWTPRISSSGGASTTCGSSARTCKQQQTKSIEESPQVYPIGLCNCNQYLARALCNGCSRCSRMKPIYTYIITLITCVELRTQYEIKLARITSRVCGWGHSVWFVPGTPVQIISTHINDQPTSPGQLHTVESIFHPGRTC